MVVKEIVSALSLQVVAGQKHLDSEISGGYASDLLSCVMAGAKANNVWVTLQAHMNVVAVAAFLDLACVVITEGILLEPDVLGRAEEKGIPILLAQEDTFTVVGKLVQLGIGATH